jgi:hypothetical protein
MAEKRIRTEPTAYVALATFYLDGATLVMAGHTVAAGHPLLRGREHLFRPFTPTWPLPGETPESEPEPVAVPDPEPEP